MSENTNPQGSVDTSVRGAANAFMSFLEPQSEEAKAQPEAVQEPEQVEEVSAAEDSEYEEQDVSAEEAESQEEEVEELPRYRVKVSGEEVEVTLDELLNGYSRTADYQKKTQSLAEQRKAVEAERIKIDEAARTRETYAQRLQVIEQLLQQQNQGEDLSALKTEDPIAYAVAMAERVEREKQLQAVQMERQRVQQEQMSHQQALLQKHIQQEQQKLVEAIPEFKDDVKGEIIRRDIRSYAKSIGFTDQELSQVYDSRAVQTLYKAMQYEKLMANKGATTKKVATAPKTIRPGTSNPQSSENEAIKKERAKLRQSGNKKDAVRLFERFL
jgi:Tfp pilus assembly protein PilN